MTTPPPLLGGRYEVLAPLGAGGMADVHRARDRVLGRDVAIKLLRANTDVDRERFAVEARILALMNHEALVTVYDAGVDDEQPWLALELVDGTTLGELLAGEPGPDVAALAGIGAQVAEGLAHAHERDVVHRDVKPSNVLVTPDGRARLTDFGIARLSGSDAHLTLTGNTIGTAAYLAPEQVRGEPVTGAADVYALGLVLLESLTGQRAYDGPPAEAALARLHHGPLIPTSLPAGWPGLLAAMTSSDPFERPSAYSAARRLHELAGRTPTAPPVVPEVVSAEVTSELALAGARPAAVPWWRTRTWRPLVAAALAFGLVLTAAALVVGGSDKPTEAEQPGSAASSAPHPTPSPSRGPHGTPSPSPASPVAEPTGADPDPVVKPRRHRSDQHGPGPRAKHSQHKPKGKAKGKNPGKAKGKHKGKHKGKGR